MKQEPCISLPVTAVDSLPTLFSDTSQLSLLSGMDTPAKSCGNEQQTDGFPACECGRGTFNCLIHPSTPASWTLFMRDSLAKTLVSLESKQAYLMEPDQVFTVKFCESLAWYDQNSCSWRTYQQSFLTDSEPYLETWPRWGMTQGGFAYAHPMSERRITETDGFSWLPTPTSSDPELERRAKHGKHFQTSTGTVRRKNEDGSSSMLGLAGYVRMWPTPTARIHKGGGRQMIRKDGKSRMDMLDWAVEKDGGRLNPQWVEHLMGFPIGFTVSKDWVTPKSRSKPPQLTDFLGDSDAP